jgi:hypothetical protein
MKNKSDIVPVGGMNKDADPRHFAQGDYLEARNMMVGDPQDQGGGGLVQNIKSTSEYTLPVIDTEDRYHDHLGVALDQENDRAYILSVIDDYTNALTYFVIYKHDLLTDTVKMIFSRPNAEWNIKRTHSGSASGRRLLSFYNPRIVDGRLIWTDDTNDIRQMDVIKMEATSDAGITTVVTLWDYYYAFTTGYTADTLVYYKQYVYKVLQSTIGISPYPEDQPLYYEQIEEVINVYLDPIDPNNFTLAALPPLIAPTAQYLPDYNVSVNQLKGQTWQFSYQYTYMDYRKSTYAPPSLVPSPDQEENVDGTPNTEPSHNNKIRVYLNTGNEQVRSISIVARSSTDPSTWFLIEEVYVVNDTNSRVLPSNQEIWVDFYNDKTGDVVPAVDVYTLFSYVPITARHMELVEGNRLVFGNIREGYPRIAVDVDIELTWEDLGGIGTQDIALNIDFDFVSTGFLVGDYKMRFHLPPSDPGALTFYIKIREGAEPAPEVTVSYVYDGITAYPASVKTGLLAAIEAQWPGETIACTTPDAYSFCAFERSGLIPHIYWLYQFYYTVPAIAYINKYSALKSGATHGWAIIYRDIVGRINPLSGIGDMTKYIPFPTENTSSNADNRAKINFNINHVPPATAVSYEIVYVGNKSIAWHLQLMGYNLSYGKKTHDTPAALHLPSELYRLRIKSVQARTRLEFPNWSVEEYVWEKGDRIRVIGKVNSVGVLTELNDVIYDVEIAGVYDDTDFAYAIGEEYTLQTDESTNEWIYFWVSDTIPLTPASGTWPSIVWSDNLYIEIYRPFKTETNVFFTTGMTYAIGTNVYGDKYHKGSAADQVLDASGNPVTPAIVLNTAHDTWKYLRSFRDVTDAINFGLWAESEYASDFYISNKLTSQGQPIPLVDSQQQNVLTKRLRHGGKVNIGSQINLIADFDFDDYLDLKDEHGPIEGLRIVGFVLKAVQYTKVVSIYISRQESFSASGDAQYLFTDKVFGSQRPAMENFGTAHPGSVLVHNRHLYFWDQSEGVIIRDAANGMEEISSYGMSKSFSDLAKTLDALSKHRQIVQFTFAKDLEQLWCVFGDKDSNDKEIFSFSEKNNRWKQILDITFNVGMFYWLGKRLFHVNWGILYEWWKGSTFLNLGGRSTQGKMVFFSTADPAKIATYDAVIVYQKGADPVFNKIEVPAKATATGRVMLTSVYAVNIKSKEGLHYCEILRDVNTPGPGTTDHKLSNGDVLRGTYVQVELLFNETTALVTLSNIIVVSTPSERSK